MLANRFWSKVTTGPTEDCWPWHGARNGNGYGLFWGRVDKRWLRAHRVSWEIAHGPIPEGMSICHHCDNPPCVNPAHLFLGTQRDNVQDMHAKGRNVSNVPTGDDHWTRQPFVGMTPAERFWSQVDRSVPDVCWPWPRIDAATDGYGRYWDPEAEQLVLAHRHAWALMNGGIPDGQRIAHVCGNHACVNPTHLYAGTLAEFFREHPERKPTYAKRIGAENPAAKLSEDDVRAIRASAATVAELATTYGISTVAIRNVIRRKTWRHVS